jgi:hypothetical protein
LTAPEEALLHLAKAREFLDAAENSRDLGLVNAAASDAVIAAINSKEAICLALTGRSGGSTRTQRRTRTGRAEGSGAQDFRSHQVGGLRHTILSRGDIRQGRRWQ